MGHRARLQPRHDSEEHRVIQRFAAQRNFSMSEYIRAATLIYTEIRTNPKYVKRFFAPMFEDLVLSGDLKKLDLTREHESEQ